jgi:hypothetical protein
MRYEKYEFQANDANQQIMGQPIRCVCTVFVDWYR